MKLDSLERLFEEQLQDVLSAEKQIMKSLPEVVKSVRSQELAEELERHFEETEDHVLRLEKVFRDIGKTPRAKHCKGMEGLLEEVGDLLCENATPETRDAGLIASLQRVEHYEIASYGALCAYADELGKADVSDQLRLSLDEEKEADDNLSEIALSGVNAAAGEPEARDA